MVISWRIHDRDGGTIAGRNHGGQARRAHGVREGEEGEVLGVLCAGSARVELIDANLVAAMVRAALCGNGDWVA